MASVPTARHQERRRGEGDARLLIATVGASTALVLGVLISLATGHGAGAAATLLGFGLLVASVHRLGRRSASGGGKSSPQKIP